jgi:hypothetical protein
VNAACGLAFAENNRRLPFVAANAKPQAAAMGCSGIARIPVWQRNSCEFRYVVRCPD